MNEQTNKNSSDGEYTLSGKKVPQTQFQTFLSELTIIPGSQINGESREGLYTHYKARDAEGRIFLVSITGTVHEIAAVP